MYNSQIKASCMKHHSCIQMTDGSFIARRDDRSKWRPLAAPNKTLADSMSMKAAKDQNRLMANRAKEVLVMCRKQRQMVKNDPSTWPRGSVRLFVKMWVDGEPASKMCDEFNMKKDSLYSAARKLQLRSRHQTPFGQSKPRNKVAEIPQENIGPEKMMKCLTCGRQFLSEGSHNRRCVSCKAIDKHLDTGLNEHTLVLR